MPSSHQHDSTQAAYEAASGRRQDTSDRGCCTQVGEGILHMAVPHRDSLRLMLKCRNTLVVIFLFDLLGLIGHAAASDELFPVWKRSDGEAHVKLSTPKTMLRGRVAVMYQLVAVNTALTTPEMVIADFGVICAPKTGEPVRLVLSHTTMYKLVGDRYVQESDEPVSPPRDVSLDSYHDFAARPAGVACARAMAMVKAPN